MKLNLTATLILSSFLTPLNVQAFESNNSYALINNLNKTLKTQLNPEKIIGIKHISTFQKNNQITILVNHNPKESYSNLIRKIARTAGRVNGINFQNSFTLEIVNTYCKKDLFYKIQSNGLNKNVIVQYKDVKGSPVAQHKINKHLCHF